MFEQKKEKWIKFAKGDNLIAPFCKTVLLSFASLVEISNK